LGHCHSAPQKAIMPEANTTAVVQLYLDALRRDTPADPIIRSLLEQAVHRLQHLCANHLHRQFARLTKPPLNLQTNELLSAVVERLLKALQEVRPTNVRQFFALAGQHLRWELCDIARRLDSQPMVIELGDKHIPTAPDSDADLSPTARHILETIGNLPDDEREVFDLVHVQGLTHAEAATVLGVADRTVKRRLDRGILLLTDRLRDLGPDEPPSTGA
jgi:RNA polymerase sigma-70 factor (ECF subfamily)